MIKLYTYILKASGSMLGLVAGFISHDFSVSRGMLGYYLEIDHGHNLQTHLLTIHNNFTYH